MICTTFIIFYIFFSDDMPITKMKRDNSIAIKVAQTLHSTHGAERDIETQERATTTDFQQERPPQWRPHNWHATTATTAFCSAKSRQDSGLASLTSHVSPEWHYDSITNDQFSQHPVHKFTLSILQNHCFIRFTYHNT